MSLWALVVSVALGSSACCSTYASRGCLTPEELRAMPVSQLVEHLRDERSWVREESARSLGLSRARDARGALEARLADSAERPWVRAAAAEALGGLGDPAALAALSGAIARPGTAPEVKISAILALCRLEGAGTEPLSAIAQLASDEDLLVAAVAENSLVSKCGGRAQ